MGREVRGGLATFFAMSYIVVLNPLIIGTVKDADGNLLGHSGDVPSAIAAVGSVTCLAAGLLTILMGVVGRYPFALAVGLGLNSFLAVAVASKVSWPEAMGLVLIEGIVITLLVLTKVRTAVLHAIPGDLKTAISVGIGLFIAFIGFVDSGFVRRVPDAAGTTVPVGLGVNGELFGGPIVVFVFGLLLTAILVMRRVRGAILIGILSSTVLAIIIEYVFKPGPSVVNGQHVATGWSLNVPRVPSDVLALPDLGLIGDVDPFGAFGRIGILAAVMIVFTLMLSDFFDTMGTVVGLSAEAKLLDKDGQVPGVGRVLFVDSVAAAAGGAMSTSSNTTYIESAAGIGEGARTGFASVVTGLMFLLAMFVAPLVSVVPFEAATPALVIVGLAMMSQIRRIDFADVGIVVPCLLTAVLMPFTYSIAAGLGAGLISYVILRSFQGRAREIHLLLWIVAVLFALYFAIHPLRQALGIV
ncbi:NCS2 family permease [Labedaea rhizosphaerae]|uniref:AGZA family xanthine/uracil permease-like MFS transporter n=1 Tax=Labedaea rhizosphaerae TaxID=598644 RepID=A0A4R6SF19_LABRH|nr:NCS2 family permease [Labedaea rhizosphaerae]TDQ00273.1 AGZA family xanthine/uracil permease-like MFS transporter [Labedaea rhizosphaerae]